MKLRLSAALLLWVRSGRGPIAAWAPVEGPRAKPRKAGDRAEFDFDFRLSRRMLPRVERHLQAAGARKGVPVAEGTSHSRVATVAARTGLAGSRGPPITPSGEATATRPAGVVLTPLASRDMCPPIFGAVSAFLLPAGL